MTFVFCEFLALTLTFDLFQEVEVEERALASGEVRADGSP